MQIALPFGLASRLFGGAGARPRITRRFAARVRKGHTRMVEAPPGRLTVHCRQGEAWITHDGDPRDVLLHAQESYDPGSRDHMSVHALEDCVMEFEVAE